MNVLLLEESQWLDAHRAVVSFRQARHIVEVLKLKDGDTIRIGKIDGLLGRGRIAREDDKFFIDGLELDRQPPPQIPLSLILAMPRPQMLKRILQTCAAMGVESIHLIHTERVEKGYWQSPSATDASIREHLILGLEQGGATQLPKIYRHLRFHTFAREALPALSQNHQTLVGHLSSGTQEPIKRNQPTCLAIGPEGGFSEKEVEVFRQYGYQEYSLGPRILRVETAVTAGIAKLFD